MGLLSLGGIVILFFDTFFVGLIITSVLLTVLHIFNKNIGTDMDWMVAVVFSLCAFLYEKVIEYSFDIKWDRLGELKCIFVYFLIFVVLIWAAFQDSQNESDKNVG